MSGQSSESAISQVYCRGDPVWVPCGFRLRIGVQFRPRQYSFRSHHIRVRRILENGQQFTPEGSINVQLQVCTSIMSITMDCEFVETQKGGRAQITGGYVPILHYQEGE